ncbi:hypothetical protein CSB45_13480 [candidate division KSB3 bacterium]|uniref:Outer membrane protein beta-barrel domain-containing protein n=1 Tax=candidate division KSB3 bacterium TaxID=2044937 RepID=A0A2G6E1P3_9BACT|nr:MAG: hypothetical protein CSB45_13480 [candidate division KSB3 bacterium]
MKKRCLWLERVVLCLVIFASVGLARELAAEEQTTGWSKGVNLGSAWCLDGYLATGLSGRVFVEYAPYIPEIGVKITGGYLRFVDDVTAGKGLFRASEEAVYDNWYLTGGMVYRFSRAKVVPFVTGNVGIYRYRKEKIHAGVGPIIDGERGSPYTVVTMHEGYAFGINGGGGIEVFLGQKTSLSLESIVHCSFGGESDQIVDLTAMLRFLP